MSPNDTDDTGELRGRADRDGRLPDDADARLERFVRNRYFTGKLMTARDMLTEQGYHGDRLETLTQRVAGRGAVCGLSIDVEQSGENEPLEISVEPGYALDCCGRPVLLDTTAHETVQPEDLPDPTEPREGELPHGIAIYIRLKECFTEKVPVNGSEDACREDCTYNRVVEDFAIVTDQNDPAVKRVNRLSFPMRADLESYDPEQGPAPDDPGLQIPAETYNEDPTREGFQHRRCPEEGDPRVFLGYYAVDDTDWWRVEDAAPRHYVYSNDMLYAAIVRHAVDFENPHDVLVGVDEYVRDKVLKYAIETVHEVAERYAELDNDHAEEVTARAREIILAARDALDAGYFRSEPAFTITGVYLAALAWALRGTLQEGVEADPELVSEESLGDYSAAFEFLWDPLTEPYMDIVHDRDRAEELWEDVGGGESPDEILADLNGEPDATELAVVLDQIVETAGWLELGEEPSRMVLPGADEEIPARIIETAIDRRGGDAEVIESPRCVDFDGFSPDWLVDCEPLANCVPSELRERRFPLQFRGLRIEQEAEDASPRFIDRAVPVGLVKLDIPIERNRLLLNPRPDDEDDETPLFASAEVEVSFRHPDNEARIVLEGYLDGELVVEDRTPLDGDDDIPSDDHTYDLRVRGDEGGVRGFDQLSLYAHNSGAELVEVCTRRWKST